jgi:hypothetical protein
MRCLTLISALMLAAPMGAQTFEGTITMRMSVPDGEPMEMKVHHADGKQAVVMSGGAGPMAGGEMRMVMNSAENRVTTFITMGGMGKFKSVSPLNSTPAGQAADADLTVTKLGTSQTVAGMRCDDYEVTDPKTDKPFRMCMTEALGRLNMPSMGGPGQGNATPAWSRAFGNRPLFPLKVWNDDSQVAVEVIRVERGSPDKALFDENTPGYMTAPAGLGGRRN